jgi:hypothetical protein
MSYIRCVSTLSMQAMLHSILVCSMNLVYTLSNVLALSMPCCCPVSPAPNKVSSRKLTALDSVSPNSSRTLKCLSSMTSRLR